MMKVMVGVFTSSVIVKRQLTQHHELIKHPEVFVKVKHLGELLKAKLCIAGLVKIQGHTAYRYSWQRTCGLGS